MDDLYQATHLRELRLLIEDICCDLCRFTHVIDQGVPAERVLIDREVCLGRPGAFADIRVATPDAPPYFVEVKNRYPADVLLKNLESKYGGNQAALHGADRVVLVTDTKSHPDWSDVEQKIRTFLPQSMSLEVWNEEHLVGLVRKHFGVDLGSLCEDDLLDLREVIDRSKGGHAFGEDTGSLNEALRASLLWHFGFWRIRQLREAKNLSPREILPPGMYRNAIVILADLSGFSGYVRDTRDDDLVRRMLTSYYTKTRYQIINRGGMLHQFVGDEAFALFGVPDAPPGFASDAVTTARALLDIGRSIADAWQRQLDRVQPSCGLHVGMAMGDVQIFPQRPYSRTHMGTVGDAIDMAGRLMHEAAAGEIVMGNSLYRHLDDADRRGFEEMPPIEARNVGRIQAWKCIFTRLLKYPMAPER